MKITMQADTAQEALDQIIRLVDHNEQKQREQARTQRTLREKRDREMKAEMLKGFADILRDITVEPSAEYGLVAAFAYDLLNACDLFTAAAQDAVEAFNAAGLSCPASIAFAAEKARNAARKARGE